MAPQSHKEGGRDFFVGKWKAVRTTGDFEQFLSDRGVPFPIRKLLGFMSTGGKFEYRLDGGDRYIEVEIGRFGSKEAAPVPLGSLKGVDGKAPSGESIQRFAKVEDGALKLTHVVRGDPEDCVDMQISRGKAPHTLEKTFTNRKTGTTFTVTLQPLDGSTQQKNAERSSSSSSSSSGTAAPKHHKAGDDSTSTSPPTTRKPEAKKPDERFFDVVSVVVLLAYVAFLFYVAKTFALRLYYSSTTTTSLKATKGGPFAFLTKAPPITWLANRS